MSQLAIDVTRESTDFQIGFCGGGGGGETCTAAFKSPDSGGPDEHAFSLRNIDRGSPSEVGFVVRHFCRTNTPHPPAPGNAPVHCYTGSLFTHHYPQGISLRLSTSGQEAGYNVALTSKHQTCDGGQTRSAVSGRELPRPRLRATYGVARYRLCKERSICWPRKRQGDNRSSP